MTLIGRSLSELPRDYDSDRSFWPYSVRIRPRLGLYSLDLTMLCQNYPGIMTLIARFGRSLSELDRDWDSIRWIWGYSVRITPEL